MDYFSVIVLIIIIFIFITDRKAKTIEEIKTGNDNIQNEIDDVKQNLEIIEVSTKDMNYDKLLKNIQSKKLEKEHIIIKNNRIKLNENDIDTLIANYISSKGRICGFNLQYSYNEKRWSIKKIYVDIINYLNIFNKQKLSTYAVIICKREDRDKLQDEKNFKENLISYTPTEFTNITLTNEEIKKDNLKKIYTYKLESANISITLKILLLIFSGSIITTNLIYYIFNVNNNINGLIIAAVIYFCYSYIIRYIYRPIGRRRVFASYIFPLYFIAYIVVSIYTLIMKVIKKVHAS